MICSVIGYVLMVLFYGIAMNILANRSMMRLENLYRIHRDGRDRVMEEIKSYVVLFKHDKEEMLTELEHLKSRIAALEEKRKR